MRHVWEWCDHCQRMVVICGKCGNNTCNGGHGIVDGESCDRCDEAYDIYLTQGNEMNSTK